MVVVLNDYGYCFVLFCLLILCDFIYVAVHFSVLALGSMLALLEMV